MTARNASTGTAALLLHGLCSTPDELLPVQHALRSAGCTVAAPRIPGYSFDPDAAEQRARPWRQWVESIRAHIAALRQDHQRVALVGISSGASLALGTAMGGTPVDALVLLSTSLRLDGWAVPRTQWLLPLALYTPLGRLWKLREKPPYGVKSERVRAFIVRELEQRRVSRAGAAVLGVGHLRENDRLLRHIRGRLPQVDCGRVLAIHAREDEIASPETNLALLAQGLGGERLRTLIVDNSYHMLSIDNDRMTVARETAAFVTQK
ncbi:MAG: alpha/beta fold hydrolase [Acidovorax sp.]